MSDEVGNGKDSNTKAVIALIDSAVFKILGKIISIVVVPIGLFFLYHAWDALEEHGKLLAGMQISLTDIKNAQIEIKNQFGTEIGVLNTEESEDRTDIAVLKSEVERPSPPLESAPVTEPQQPVGEHHFHRQISHPSNPLVDAIQKTFLKPIGKAINHPPTHEGGR